MGAIDRERERKTGREVERKRGEIDRDVEGSGRKR